MGKALQVMNAIERENIAREILTEPLTQLVHGRVSSHCPFHVERTAGGAFFYDAEEDLGYCHSCNESSDLIGLYCVTHGYEADSKEGFKEFFDRYAPDKLKALEGAPRAPRQEPKAWEARQIEAVPTRWADKASEFVTKCAAALQENETALAQLRRWGIGSDTAKFCRIGFCDRDRFFKYTAWGLPYAKNGNGRERCIFAPEGLVFPCYQQGVLQRIKIRVDQPKENTPKYRALEGGSTVYGVWGNPAFRVWIVVETERDAIYCWQELRRYGIGAMASGSASIAPDSYAHALLCRAECVINAMDNDQAGAKRSWGFQENDRTFYFSQYASAVRWLVPSCMGKDVGDVPSTGADLWRMLREALPSHIRAYCESYQERAKQARQREKAKKAMVLDWPSVEELQANIMELVEEGYDSEAVNAYEDLLLMHSKYGLDLVRHGQTLRIESKNPDLTKADQEYLQNFLDNEAYGLSPAILKHDDKD